MMAMQQFLMEPRIVQKEMNPETRKRPLEDKSTSPIKRKIPDSENYHYNKLFLEGEKSDITLNILDKQYFLHKVFLSQSPYFASMFGGAWLESNEKSVTIEIIDDIITCRALEIVFGSLYSSSITVTALEAVSVLAAAYMFQLNGLITECETILIDNICRQTVLQSYQVACRYSVKNLKDKCFEWFLINYPYLLLIGPSMPLEFAIKILSHPEVFSKCGEGNIYHILKMYIFVKETGKSYERSLINEFFSSKTVDKPYLCLDEGLKYVPLFQTLRLRYLVCSKFYEVILNDKIIPEDWLTPHVVVLWKNMFLKDNFELEFVNVTEEYFLANCQRNSCYITSPTYWDWQNHPFGRRFGIFEKDEENNTSIELSIYNSVAAELPVQRQITLSTKFIALRIMLIKFNDQSQSELWCKSKIIKISSDKQGKIYEFENIGFPLGITMNMMHIDSLDPSIDVEDLS